MHVGLKGNSPQNKDYVFYCVCVSGGAYIFLEFRESEVSNVNKIGAVFI